MALRIAASGLVRMVAKSPMVCAARNHEPLLFPDYLRPDLEVAGVKPGRYFGRMNPDVPNIGHVAWE
jgi:hypothetical protein